MEIQTVTQPVQKELEAFNELYMKALNRSVNHFQFMLDFVSEKKGKRIRPLVLILSAKLCGGITQKTLDYAVILELLHTATLIHDDVVDNTPERRGQPSVMAKYDNRTAVLLGDYILSQAIVRGVDTENQTILRIMANLAQNLAEGELTQLISSSELIVDEECYFEIIRKKTAVLLSSCSEMGALSVGADAERTETLRSVGTNLGLCFQIKDDVFDYFEQGDIGKPTGNDIREGKITLPLIYALKNAPDEPSGRMTEILRNRDFSQENVKRLIDFAKEYKGIEYARLKMQEIKEKTIGLLRCFPDTPTKTAMINLIDYIIEREK
ncbi:MAG: polyprenyl synthetase family protein [Dysgonamonadaceae bacterium]|jgi:octaprenyl-diphosphate synthase|nr:polyprenyl synthetase family protein [Dysgonamonadaceae bacterium]